MRCSSTCSPTALTCLHELSSDPDINVPIAAHPAMAGALYPSPHYGIAAPLLLGKLMRLAGADLVLFPSPYGSVVMPKEENHGGCKQRCSAQRCRIRTSFPVPSAGIHPGLVPLIFRDFGTTSSSTLAAAFTAIRWARQLADKLSAKRSMPCQAGVPSARSGSKRQHEALRSCD